MNNCKIRLLKQVCSEEDYVKKLSSLNANSDFAWEETPECPKNYDKSYCDISAIESLTGLPPNWVRNLFVTQTYSVVFYIVLMMTNIDIFLMTNIDIFDD